MKIATLAVVSAFAATAIAGPIRPDGVGSDKFLIELGPGETQWVTKQQKHEMRAVCPSYTDT